MTDYKLQIASRQKELASITESFQKAQADWEKQGKELEERVKKQKQLLGQASKSLQESKRLQADRDAEIASLKTALEEARGAASENAVLVKEQKKNIDRLAKELAEEREKSAIKIAELERESKDAAMELTSVKAEFQSYKVRAVAALQKSSVPAMGSRVSDLEATIDQLQTEKIAAAKSLSDAMRRISELEADVQTTVDQLVAMENRFKRVEGSSRDVMLLKQELDAANKRLAMEQQLAEEAIKSKDTQFASSLESVRAESKRIIAELDAQLQHAKQDLDTATAAVERTAAESSALRADFGLF
ncbi:hypothetical protein DFJ73DRAFT_218807 [Zopfochytrium polystomum]|nr:hypothetical protein DFJ73DRAFT_218807 [Zopfochytrium polystomum]